MYSTPPLIASAARGEIMNETPILKNIQVELSKHDARLFRNNVGTGWAGNDVYHARTTGAVLLYPGDVVVRNARPLHTGFCTGSSDLIGWTPRVFDGQKIAVFTAVEVKTPKGRATPEQVKFITAVRKAGGISFIARSPEEAVQLLKGANFDAP